MIYQTTEIFIFSRFFIALNQNYFELANKISNTEIRKNWQEIIYIFENKKRNNVSLIHLILAAHEKVCFFHKLSYQKFHDRTRILTINLTLITNKL